jgi:hypothetical protein
MRESPRDVDSIRERDQPILEVNMSILPNRQNSINKYFAYFLDGINEGETKILAMSFPHSRYYEPIRGYRGLEFHEDKTLNTIPTLPTLEKETYYLVSECEDVLFYSLTQPTDNNGFLELVGQITEIAARYIKKADITEID